MSLRKIVFITTVIILLIVAIFSIWRISTTKERNTSEKVDTLSIWVVGGTTEQYNLLLSDFAKYDKKYAKTNIDIRVFPDYDQYRRILLSTLADGGGPDIFMVEASGDRILETKIEPIPEDFIDFSYFEKDYEDIFLSLITFTGSGDKKKRYLKGVPIGYETLGVFYNKSLLLSFPKTWNEVDSMYESDVLPNILPTNIGMGERFTPFSSDIIASFLLRDGIYSYEKIGGSSALSDYRRYAQVGQRSTQGSFDDNTIEVNNGSLYSKKGMMENEKLSTIDLFIRGNIAFVVGYQSLISEIEKAYKRAGGKATEGIILTERLPSSSLEKPDPRLARYTYLAISSKTKYPKASLSVLSYLLTDEAIRKREQAFPLLISPRRSDYEKQYGKNLSEVFAKTKIDAFIPKFNEKVALFDYGIKTSFSKSIEEDIDRNEKIDNKILDKISQALRCEIESSEKGTLSEECLREKY